MWLADNWKDYEVLDTSNGEKLERWGNYLLVRPDPQVVWNTPHTNPGWKKKNGHYHRSSSCGVGIPNLRPIDNATGATVITATSIKTPTAHNNIVANAKAK